MIEIDGSHGSGSGTILRLSVALAVLFGRPLHVKNVRAGRKKPGLRPQHLAAVRACAELCDAETDGLEVGSRDVRFEPRRRPRGGSYTWEIGTAGSTTMLALGLLPLAAWADGPVTAKVKGGVFQDFAPSPHHLGNVLLPLLRRMGLWAEVRVLRPGYVPRGDGEIELRVEPLDGTLAPVVLEEPGKAAEVGGVALSSRLEDRRVSDRMAEVCERRLASESLISRIDRVYDRTANQPGASLAVWTATSTGCLLGADRAGAPRRSSESIGRAVAGSLLADLATGATVDRHAADMLVPWAGLARGISVYRVPRATDHLDTNLWLVERFGIEGQRDRDRVRIDGIGLARE